MMREVVNRLRGQVRIRVECAFPERVLNICAEHGLRFWDLRWESAVAFTFTLYRRDWKKLRRLSRRLDCQMEAVNWRGTPFFLGRLRHRYGLWVTLTVCVALLLCGSFFIWDFEIEGNEAISDIEILRALEKYDVGFGSFGYGVNSFRLRNDLMLELPELSYIAINVRGCRAYVQVRERIPAPEIISRRQPGNTVAARDALVTAVQPWDGEKMVLTPTYYTFLLYKCHQDATLLESTIETCGVGQAEHTVVNLHESASVDAEGNIHITVCNLSHTEDYEIDTEIVSAEPKRIVAEILTGAMNAHNTFEEAHKVDVQNFTDYQMKDGHILLRIPACSVLHLEIRK